MFFPEQPPQSAEEERMRQHYSIARTKILADVATPQPFDQKDVDTLLSYVARHDRQMETMIRFYPHLLLRKGTVTDYSHRTFKGITAFQ
jgi:hypothetical protein